MTAVVDRTTPVPSPGGGLPDLVLDPALPVPPDERTKWAYLGRQHRWLLVLQFVAFVGVAVSFTQFALESWLTIPLLLPLALFSVTSVVSLRSSSRRRRIATRAEHERFVADWRPEHVPTVDVFLPSAGEPLEILANTFQYVARMEWPSRLQVFVLDDSARDAVRQLADRYGFVYLTRPDRGRLKKAGNLRYGYEHSTGDVIAVFDADFVPRADYLRELVPYFDDPEVGIVQSPQYFETRRPMSWLERCAGATQELFYRFVQPSRDRVDAAICVGTCGVYRRRSLEQAGGFAQIGHSEDVHTGVNMLKSGHHVRYVPVVGSMGLCPDRITAFVSQQYRWCTGSMSLLADVAFHASTRIDRRQRWCFWSGFLYYIGTAVSALVAPLPLIAMVWLFPELVKPSNTVPLLGAVLLWFVVLPAISHARWRPEVLRVQTLYGFSHLVAIWDLMREKASEWVPTNAASSTPTATKTKRLMVAYLSVTSLVGLVGIARGAAEYGIADFTAVALFALFRLYVNVPVIAGCVREGLGLRVRLPRRRGRHRTAALTAEGNS